LHKNAFGSLRPDPLGGKGKERVGNRGRRGVIMQRLTRHVSVIRGERERRGERIGKGEGGLDLNICPGGLRVPSYATGRTDRQMDVP